MAVTNTVQNIQLKNQAFKDFSVDTKNVVKLNFTIAG